MQFNYKVSVKKVKNNIRVFKFVCRLMNNSVSVAYLHRAKGNFHNGNPNHQQHVTIN